MLDVSVIIATYGDDSWIAMAREAAKSAHMAGAPEVIEVHADSLHEARNKGLELSTRDWVIHLDADDFLLDNFIEKASQGTADIRVPSICYSYDTSFDIRTARIPLVAGHSHNCEPNCLEFGNYVIIGALARKDVILEAGGWRDYEALEDYDLWQRCWLTGASFQNVPEAIYLARCRVGSRNRQRNAREMAKIQHKICQTNMPNKDWSWLLR